MAAKGAAKGTLNAKNLEGLGAARLAELLILLCEGNNASKRLLRLALAEQKRANGDGAGAAQAAGQHRPRMQPA